MLKLVQTHTGPAATVRPFFLGRQAPLRFADVLRLDYESRVWRRKSARTQARLLLATALALEDHGFSSPRVVDITQGAGVSTAAYYVYFHDLDEGVCTVLSRFGAWLFEPFDDERPEGGAAIRALLTRAHANLNLVRALDRVLANAPSLAEGVGQARLSWARALCKGRPAESLMCDGLIAGLLREMTLSDPTEQDVEAMAELAVEALRRLTVSPLTPAA
ncbi:TetR/AcrR family transcriptional regulator [Phenylobacterium soli]|uniref:HTH tetR-type domain-containing protein n=1 Tax=Phenylobacterium soli TaxID=2170551 RepID=A0A328AL80_9CAUL|nr:hypothetical protein [Phenylobacterium soli]RAK55145.1 hypothetical protein DJ017_11755 [Phenylobacterium soli]